MYWLNAYVFIGKFHLRFMADDFQGGPDAGLVHGIHEQNVFKEREMRLYRRGNRNSPLLNRKES